MTVNSSQLGIGSEIRIDREDLHTVNISLPQAASSTLVVGQAVKVTTAGEADAIASAEDFAGVVIVPKQKDGKVTVRTAFHTVVVGKAKVAINAGQLVKEVGADTLTNAKPTYDLAASTNYAVGRALSTAGIGANIKIGIFFSPIVKS